MENPTPPNELAVPMDEFEAKPLETPLTPPSSAPMSRTSTNSLTIIPKLPIANVTVKLTKPVEPLVTYSEMLRFVVWGIVVVLTQLWRDLLLGRVYRPLLSTDFMTHFFYIPNGRHDPRIVTSGPYNRLTIKDIPPSTTPQWEQSGDLSIYAERDIINGASNNYGGFAHLEPGMDKVIQAGLRSLPFCPPPQQLDDRSRAECARYMGFDEAFTAPSGFSTNVLAFATVAGVAAAQGRHVVFLMDHDCHNSMFTGAFYNKGARVHKFKHNDIGELEFKLRMYRDQDPDAFMCVAIEGVYSMEGAVSPAPAILALKRLYNFSLLVDEAHSFMAMGSHGRGSFNYWQDAGYDCPLKSVDVMSCMFSKSVGCTGGCVFANGLFATELRCQGEKLVGGNAEKLSTIIHLRILGLLRKPMLIQHRMTLVREKSAYVAKALTAAGCKVLGSPGSAIICFPVGTVRQVVFFHSEAMKAGLATTGGVPPATPLWGCRIRLSVFATTPWADIYRLLTIITSVCQKIKVHGVESIALDESLLERYDTSDDLLEEQSHAVNQQLDEFIEALRIKFPIHQGDIGSSAEVIEAASQGLQKYGIGPCSARWYYGSFDSFVRLEQRLARLYPSLLAQSGKCRALICGDAEVTLSSTVTALAIPTASSGTNNIVFIPSQAPKAILEGAALAKETKSVSRRYYDTVDMLPSSLDIHKPSHLTFYFLTCDASGGQILDLFRVFHHPVFQDRGASSSITGITVMLDDRNGLGKIGPNKLGYLDHVEAEHGASFLVDVFSRLSVSARVIVAGSWYDAFGHQGGYVTGHADTVEALTWDAKAYFFSTPPMPLQACMTDKAIELLQRRRDASSREEAKNFQGRG